MEHAHAPSIDNPGRQQQVYGKMLENAAPRLPQNQFAFVDLRWPAYAQFKCAPAPSEASQDVITAKVFKRWHRLTKERNGLRSNRPSLSTLQRFNEMQICLYKFTYYMIYTIGLMVALPSVTGFWFCCRMMHVCTVHGCVRSLCEPIITTAQHFAKSIFGRRDNETPGSHFAFEANRC